MYPIISISKNRVVVELENGQIIQFVVWDLKEPQHENFKDQLMIAFNICRNFSEIEKHLCINGFDAHIEEIRPF